MSEDIAKDQSNVDSAFAFISLYSSVLGVAFIALTFFIPSDHESVIGGYIASFFVLITVIFAISAVVQRCLMKRRYWWLSIISIGIIAFCFGIITFLYNSYVVFFLYFLLSDYLLFWLQAL